MPLCFRKLVAASAREVIGQGWLWAWKSSVWLHIWYFDKGDDSDMAGAWLHSTHCNLGKEH